MQTTKLQLVDMLPLTCTRTGTCCHGNQVNLNPWELSYIAKEKKITPREFLTKYTEDGGIRLRFDGPQDARGKNACSQYIENFGCNAHIARPLACRLYPLGRQIQSGEVNYIHQGSEFPCLQGCPEVVELPKLSVEEYLKGQQTDKFEQAQDNYLELMQQIADIAFMLLLETALAESDDTKTLQTWRIIGNEAPEQLSKRIGNDWLEALLLPKITTDIEEPSTFIETHFELLQTKAQEQFENLQTLQELHEASVLMMAIALYIAKSIGANPKSLAEHWIDAAKEHGAKES